MRVEPPVEYSSFELTDINLFRLIRNVSKWGFFKYRVRQYTSRRLWPEFWKKKHSVIVEATPKTYEIFIQAAIECEQYELAQRMKENKYLQYGRE